MTTTAAPPETTNVVAVCTYSLWVPEAAALDRTRAFRLWSDTVQDHGFEIVRTPVIESVEHERLVQWFVRGGVRARR